MKKNKKENSLSNEKKENSDIKEKEMKEKNKYKIENI